MFSNRVAINLENMENSGNLNFVEKPGKLKENSKYVTSSVNMYSNELFSLKLLRENLKVPWKSQRKLREFSLSKMRPP